MKRVVGVPGDRVEVKDGQLWRNGGVADEPFILERMAYTWGPVTCSPDHVLLLGDNRNNSRDSHDWTALGPGGKPTASPELPVEAIEGKALFVVFPPQRVGRLRREGP